jgi:hypothetical protein
VERNRRRVLCCLYIHLNLTQLKIFLQLMCTNTYAIRDRFSGYGKFPEFRNDIFGIRICEVDTNITQFRIQISVSLGLKINVRKKIFERYAAF